MRTIQSTDPSFQSALATFCRGADAGAQVQAAVAEILGAVRGEGDAAVTRFSAKFDKAVLKPAQFRVSEKELAAAAKRLPAGERKAIVAAQKNIRFYNAKSFPKNWTARNPHGATVGENFFPIRRCGLYIPGGQVPLVSTVLMTVTLAQIAGVPEIVVVTPPAADGSVSPALLGALHIAGVREVYRVGGVQAIGALAFGTETIRAVDKIFGPGNAYTVEAKRQVFGTVGIDLIPGPSEVMVIADARANPAYVAADLLAQAEHGSGKERVFLVSDSEKLLRTVEAEIAAQLATLSRAERIEPVLAAGALAILVPSMNAAAEVANYVAPEHLELHVSTASQKLLLKKVTTAGAILLGEETPTVLGDFVAGPSHTLPTGRTGRFFSGLRVADFMRRTSVVRYEKKSLKRAAATVAAFSAMEQLDAHGRSLTIRFEKGKGAR